MYLHRECFLQFHQGPQICSILFLDVANLQILTLLAEVTLSVNPKFNPNDRNKFGVTSNFYRFSFFGPLLFRCARV